MKEKVTELQLKSGVYWIASCTQQKFATSVNIISIINGKVQKPRVLQGERNEITDLQGLLNEMRTNNFIRLVEWMNGINPDCHFLVLRKKSVITINMKNLCVDANPPVLCSPTTYYSFPAAADREGQGLRTWNIAPSTHLVPLFSF